MTGVGDYQELDGEKQPGPFKSWKNRKHFGNERVEFHGASWYNDNTNHSDVSYISFHFLNKSMLLNVKYGT